MSKHNIAVFLDFLRTRGLESLDTLQAEDLSAFVRTRTAWKPRTVACVSSSLRLFLQYLFMRDILPRDFSAAIPTVRLASNAKVPSAWEPELVERLLAAVDRSSPKGKRDYAILLLAARLGRARATSSVSSSTTCTGPRPRSRSSRTRRGSRWSCL